MDANQLWQEYTQGKQTLKQLSVKHSLSIRTIQRRLDSYHISKHKTVCLPQHPLHIIIDTTYFGRHYGIMTVMDNHIGKVLYHKKIPYEKNEHYKLAIQYLQAQGFVIHSITCDGRRGLLGGFDTIPTQMCHFHQRQIIVRYLTRKPKYIASIELLSISKQLGQVNQMQFIKLLDDWYLTHESYLNERSYGDDGKRSWYTHKRLRQAYLSLRRNTKYLFVYQTNPCIPNTTNKLEGLFSQLKQKLRCHQGLNQDRQLKFIDDFMIKHG